MFCPSCGKEIASTDLRFCSACGLRLHGVLEVVKNDGDLPPQEFMNMRLGLRRKDGLKVALLIFFVGTFLLTPLAAVFSDLAGFADAGVAAIAILSTMLPLVIAVGSVMFLPKELKAPPATRLTPPGGPLPIRGAATINSLPEGNATPASGYAPPSQGAWKDVEYSTPGSVTEGTTKLLREDSEE